MFKNCLAVLVLFSALSSTSFCSATTTPEIRKIKFTAGDYSNETSKILGKNDPVTMLVPDFQSKNSSAIRKILKDLNCTEKPETKVYKGGYGRVRLTITKAIKLSFDKKPALERQKLAALAASLIEKPVYGLSLCLPQVFYTYTGPDNGNNTFNILVLPRVHPVKPMRDVLFDAYFLKTPHDKKNLASFSHCLGVMQSRSMNRSQRRGLEGELVCDAHFDLGVDNVLMTKEAENGTQGDFTLIDNADFVRGNSNSAPPLSVDITYFYLRSLELCQDNKKHIGIDQKTQNELFADYSLCIYEGYFSAFTKVQLKELAPIFTTKRAYDLFKGNLEFGNALYNKENDSSEKARQSYLAALPYVTLAYYSFAGFGMLIEPAREAKPEPEIFILDDEPLAKKAKPCDGDDDIHPSVFGLPYEEIKIRMDLLRHRLN